VVVTDIEYCLDHERPSVIKPIRRPLTIALSYARQICEGIRLIG
jgi:hypothetical protein